MTAEASSSLGWFIGVFAVVAGSVAGLAIVTAGVKEQRGQAAVAAESARELERAESRLEGVEIPSAELSECVTKAFGEHLAAAGVLSVETGVQEATCWPARSADVFVDAGQAGCFTSYVSKVAYASDWEVGASRVVAGPGAIRVHLAGDSYFFSLRKAGERYEVGVSDRLSSEHSAASVCQAMGLVVAELSAPHGLPPNDNFRQPTYLPEPHSPSGVGREQVELL